MLRALDQPVFKIAIDSAGCRFEVRINDVPILRENEIYPNDLEWPVNEWMARGRNRISAHIKPPPILDDEGNEEVDEQGYDLEESWLKLRLTVKKNGGDRSTIRTIASLNFLQSDAWGPHDGTQSSSRAGVFSSADDLAADPGGDVLVSGLTFRREEATEEIDMARTVTLPLEFPAWQWLAGSRISPTDETAAELRRVYAQFWRALNEKRFEQVAEWLRPKIAEYAAAYYLSSEQAAEMTPVFDLMRSEDVTLQEVPELLRLDVFGEGRLARLTDEDGEAPIVFANKDGVGYFVGLTHLLTPQGFQLTR